MWRFCNLHSFPENLSQKSNEKADGSEILIYYPPMAALYTVQVSSASIKKKFTFVMVIVKIELLKIWIQVIKYTCSRTPAKCCGWITRE